MTANDKIPNRLSQEKSPYLLQHAYNPVNWYPWGEAAFQEAKEKNKPVFLSIGYSTCHWCHVMERESFEDQEVADLLNSHFVSIKVDREERPDIDHIYMSVCQAMTGHGGWPLTVVMTPEQKPFFTGTYFPKHSRMGMPGLMDILKQISSRWESNRDDLLGIGNEVSEAIQGHLLTAEPGELSQYTLDQAYELLEKNFDAKFGGFGKAPKFPTPHNLAFLLRYHKSSGKPRALAMVETTLMSMAAGGIYDHVGFGFSRYSTDRQWLVPHFEKMLYDNALLAWVLLETYQVTKNTEYARRAQEIFTYVLRDMTSPEGGFYSAEDADSEGVEGKFYVWEPVEIRTLLGEELGSLYCQAYDITPQGNFEGKNIPNLIKADWHRLAQEHRLTLPELKHQMSVARGKLFQAREQRIHPHKDDKILTSWNGLMIAALAKGSQVLNQPEYSNAAAKAVRFLLDNLVNSAGRLLARYRDGEAAYPAYVDDYAFLIWGLLELYEATFEISYLKQALSLNAQLLELCWDSEAGGLFMYGKDSEQLITRPKEVYDGATPSGNSVAALNFLRLARITGQTDLEEMTGQIFHAFAGTIGNYPAGYTFMLNALWFALAPGKEIVIAGDHAQEQTKQMLEVVRARFLPEAVVMFHSPGLTELIPSLAEQKSLAGQSTAYVCENFACQAPVTEAKELANLL
ncbi:MAG TPA: thioredoxin domain-containing protein [Verrucomicrobiae bacterium]|nr:thioredoxin domain-containing protein [Verrucomicrobiae bacterium]